MASKIVIIGNGIAGLSAVKAIREVDNESEIHLVGQETYYPYNRIRLSKGSFSSLKEEKILLREKDWYYEKKLILYFGVKVSVIDTKTRKLDLSNGKTVSYDKLLIATGSHSIEPPVPGIKKAGVYTLKTLLDARNIIEHVKNSKKVLIIGGGIQGLETAWILSEMDVEVTICQRSDKLMRKEVNAKASQILEKAIKHSGVNTLFNTEISEVIGGDNVEAFKTTKGEIYECDTIIYSIGTKPNLNIVESTSIKYEYGIVVNDRMETNVENIYAAGDVAQYQGNVYGLWNIAIGQGITAGYNMCGKETKFPHTMPIMTLVGFNLSLFSMGVIDEDSEATIIEEHPSKNNYRKIFIKNGKVIGAIIVGDIKSSPGIKDAIEKGIILKNLDYKNITYDELIELIKDSKIGGDKNILVVKLCENNNQIYTSDFLGTLRNQSVDIQVEPCLGFCGHCAVNPFAIVNDELVQGETIDKLFNNIKNKLNQTK